MRTEGPVILYYYVTHVVNIICTSVPYNLSLNRLRLHAHGRPRNIIYVLPVYKDHFIEVLRPVKTWLVLPDWSTLIWEFLLRHLSLGNHLDSMGY